MKKYSQARAGRGKTAYRTPSDFRYRNIQKIRKQKIKVIKQRPFDAPPKFL